MKHILLLEDDSGIVDLLSVILEEAGYYVSTTALVNDAKEMLERSKGRPAYHEHFAGRWHRIPRD